MPLGILTVVQENSNRRNQVMTFDTYSEYIVPKAEQVTIRYVVEFN